MVYRDNEYSVMVANQINHLNASNAKRNQLTNTKSTLTGGAINMRRDYERVLTLEQMGNKPILSGNFPTYPHLNISELAMANSSKPNPLLYQSLNNARVSGGGFLDNAFKFLKPVASLGLDKLADVAGEYTGMPNLSKAVREGVKGVTGVGLKKRGRKSKMVGVGEYKTGGCMDCGNTCDMTSSKKTKKGAGVKSAGAKSGGKSKGSRMDMVRKIMKEKGLNLGQASKHIKDNNLY